MNCFNNLYQWSNHRWEALGGYWTSPGRSEPGPRTLWTSQDVHLTTLRPYATPEGPRSRLLVNFHAKRPSELTQGDVNFHAKQSTLKVHVFQILKILGSRICLQGAPAPRSS